MQQFLDGTPGAETMDKGKSATAHLQEPLMNDRRFRPGLALPAVALLLGGAAIGLTLFNRLA